MREWRDKDHQPNPLSLQCRYMFVLQGAKQPLYLVDHNDTYNDIYVTTCTSETNICLNMCACSNHSCKSCLIDIMTDHVGLCVWPQKSDPTYKTIFGNPFTVYLYTCRQWIICERSIIGNKKKLDIERCFVCNSWLISRGLYAENDFLIFFI